MSFWECATTEELLKEAEKIRQQLLEERRQKEEQGEAELKKVLAEREREIEKLNREKKKLEGRGLQQTRYNNPLYVVSITHPSLSQDGGSHYWAEVPGRTAAEAAQSYLNVQEDNEGAALARKDPDVTIICVLDPTPGQNGKPWKIWLYNIVTGMDMYGKTNYYVENFF